VGVDLEVTQVILAGGLDGPPGLSAGYFGLLGGGFAMGWVLAVVVEVVGRLLA
jgi:hypothetical protein